ncbi:hypothetical protein [Streptomyces sp. WM6368]|uniref:hypothetical protein n=1 Tax=Streptomyces sp. WM6368 TaxID=1415554 RepID=UPI00131A892E|nr:hypothetical protein [Streptomyces sp. WM6368]
MSAGTAPDGPHPGVDGMCEQIRGALAGWAHRLLGVHIPQTVLGPAELARLIATIAAAAEVTVLPGEGAAAWAELRVAADRASAAALVRQGSDVRADLAAVRAGCRRAAVAVGEHVAVDF